MLSYSTRRKACGCSKSMSKNIILSHPCFISPVHLDKLECKHRLGLDGKRVVLLFGFVSRSKGHDMAIRCLASPRVPRDMVVYVAGEARVPEDQPFVDSLKELAHSLSVEDRVLFHGYVNEMEIPIVLGSADLAVMPYHHIVQSGAVFYPMAYNVPVLASDIGGFRELAERGCIYTFREGDQEDLLGKLVGLLSDPKMLESLETAGKNHCEQVSVHRMSERLVKIYDQAGGSV